jgi:hypothetical protein
VKCPSSIGIPEEKHRMMGIVRRRQETVHRRFKQWSSLKQVFRYDLCMHGRGFTAIVVISQLAIENGEPLFQVDIMMQLNFKSKFYLLYFQIV